MKLDNFDRKLLHELMRNSREKTSTLSKRLRMPKTTINFRVRRLIKRGVIRNFYTLLNMSPLGYHYFTVYLNFGHTTRSKEVDIINELKTIPNVSLLNECEGTYNIILNVISKSNEELQQFIMNLKQKYSEDLSKIDVDLVVRTHYFSNSDPTYTSLQHFKYQEINLDEIDKNLLSNLSLGARNSLMSLSMSIGESPQLIKYRIKRLEEQQVIRAYRCDVNWSKLNYSSYTIAVNVSYPNVVKDMISFFTQKDICISATEMVGKYDIAFKVILPVDKSLRSIIDEFKMSYGTHIGYYDVYTILTDYRTGWTPYQKPEQAVAKETLISEAAEEAAT